MITLTHEYVDYPLNKLLGNNPKKSVHNLKTLIKDMDNRSLKYGKDYTAIFNNVKFNNINTAKKYTTYNNPNYQPY